MNRELGAILEMPDVRGRFQSIAIEISSGRRADFRALIQRTWHEAAPWLPSTRPLLCSPHHLVIASFGDFLPVFFEVEV